MQSEDPLCTLLRNVTDPVYKPDPSTRPSGVAFERVQFPLENTLLILFLLTFVFFKFAHPSRKHFHRLQIRKTSLLVITHFGASMSTTTGAYNDLNPLPWTLPCSLYYIFMILIPACVIVPQITQMITFYRNDQLTQTVFRRQQRAGSFTSNVRQSPVRESRRVSMGLAVGDNMAQSDVDGRLSWWRIVQIAVLCRSMNVDGTDESPVAGTSVAIPNNQVAPESEARGTGTKATGGNGGQQQRWADDVRVMNFLRSRKAEAIVVSIFFLPFIIAIAVVLGTEPMVAAGCWGCYAQDSVNILLISLGIFVIMVLIVSYRANIKKLDPFGIINEIRMIVWLGGVPAVVSMILSVILNWTGDFYFAMLIEIFLTIICFIQSVLQCILAIRDRNKENEAALLYEMSPHDFEEQVIKTKSPYHSAFEAHLVSEHGYESLAFLLGVQQWEDQFFDSNAKTNRVRAKKLMNMYVGDQAVLPCNLPDTIVKRMKTQMNTADDLTIEFFKPAKEEITLMLYRDSFMRFLNTKAFRNIREQLIQQGQQGGGLGNQRALLAQSLVA